MAHSYHNPPPLKFDVKVVRLADFGGVDPERRLFIRYHIFAGDGRRILIDTREISSMSDLDWSEFASFECRGSLDPVGELIEPQILVFELRHRRRRVIFGRITRSKLLGRGEVAWKDVARARGMSLEKWVKLHMIGQESDSFKLPTLLVELKIQAMDGRNKRIEGRRMGWKRCDCEDCEWIGSEEDMFQAATITNQ